MYHMNIGVLTYHKSCNFGANLQAYSTLNYLKKSGYNPVLIDYFPESLYVFGKNLSDSQQSAHYKFFDNKFSVTKTCTTAQEIATEISNNNINNIIIGSDAVFNVCPNLCRIGISRKRIINFINPVDTLRFPNAFWGVFNDYVNTDLNVCVMSASSQNAKYKRLMPWTKRKMANQLKKMSYISVRDKWTKAFLENISHGEIVPDITPDPVFAFNNNVESIPSEEYIQQKFGVKPRGYVLLGFRNRMAPNANWLSSFVDIVKKNALECVYLPMPDLFGEQTLQSPISPLEWYALIKYSAGYVGNNMHPIVIALHNSIPFYSFDQYGVFNLLGYRNEKASKTFDVLEKAEMLDYRTPFMPIKKVLPSPEYVWKKITEFDTSKCSEFAKKQFDAYQNMMNNIVETFK